MKRRRRVVKMTGDAESPAPDAATARAGDWRRGLLPSALIVLATIWVYAPAIRGDWLWDDKQLIRDNAYYIHDAQGLARIWLDPGRLPDFYPLLTSAEWAEWHLWHRHVAGYHLVNLVLHVLSAFLLWRLLARLGIRMAWVGGLIFAIHPAQVESVAWMAEFKNTLSLPPFLLAVISYVSFDTTHRKIDYGRSVGWFIVAMLCKTTMVMFPVVILLYAWWKRGRIGVADVKNSAAFFAVSLVLGAVTFWFQQHNAFNGAEVTVGGMGSRLALVGSAMAFYFFECVWPVGLLPMYPKWTIDPPAPIEFVPWLVLAAVLGAAWTRRSSWGRHVLFGLGFFLINLAPFVGLTTPYFMNFAWVFDHVLYIPIIGIVALMAAGVGIALESSLVPVRRGAIAAVTAYGVFLGAVGHWYSGKFADQVTLWTYTLEHNPDAWPAHNNLGNYLFSQGRISEAMDHYRQAIRVAPQAAELYLNLGNGYLHFDQNAAAIEQYQKAIAIAPGNVDAHFSMGVALARLKRLPEAIEQYETVVALDPDNMQAHQNLGEIFMAQGRSAEAVKEYQAALRNDPHFAHVRAALQQQSTSTSAPGN